MSYDSSLTEIYCTQLQNPEPAYYARIPGVLYKATYLEEITDSKSPDCGKRIRKKLSANAIHFYSYLKQLAGSGSACWASGEHYAEECGLSTGTISKVKKELQKPIEQLNNQPLIKVEKRKRRMQMPDGSVKVTPYDHITILDIWRFNNAHMSVQSKIEKLKLGIVDNYGSHSPNETDTPSSSPGESDPRRSVSPGETNNRITEEESFCYRTDSAATANCDCQQTKKETVISLAQGLDKEREVARAAMKNNGCDDNFINEMLRRFSPQRIIDAGNYTYHQFKRGNVKSNAKGYLRIAIEKGLKWKIQ